MMGTTCINATTLDDAALAERVAAARPGGSAALGALARLATIVLGLIRLFSWLWVVVCAILTVLSAYDWLGGKTHAGPRTRARA